MINDNDPLFICNTTEFYVTGYHTGYHTFHNTITSDYLCFPLTPDPRPAYVVIIEPRGH